MHAKFLMYYTPYSISFLCMYPSRVENSLDPDQMALKKPADLDLQCFQKLINLG